jgi:uncharacterized membrane protein YhaH (DUF805 family)
MPSNTIERNTAAWSNLQVGRVDMKITQGRFSRIQYFVWMLPSAVLFSLLKNSDELKLPDSLTGIIAWLFLLSIPIIWIATVRRSHDIGRSGWFALIFLIPFAQAYLLFKRGEPGPNKYGPPPGGIEQDTEEMTEQEKEREVQRLLRASKNEEPVDTPDIKTANSNRFCNYCGVPNPSDAQFCSACGRVIARLSPVTMG